MFRRSKSVVGLDLGSQFLKAIEITMEPAGPVISGYSRLALRDASSREAAVGELLAGGGIRAKQVVTSVAGQSVVVRYIPMVQMSDSELRQAIQFESDKYLPFAAEDVVLDCHRLGHKPAGEADADKMSVVLVACQKGVVHGRLQQVTTQGLVPIAVDVDAFALANAWEQSRLNTGAEVVTSDDVATALVDIGASRTQINVLRAGETCFSREIGMGGIDMTKAIARRLGMADDDAEALKCEPGEREIEVARTISPVLEDLVAELNLSLDFVENREGVRVDEVKLSGGGVLAPGAVEYIEQATGRNATLWNPLEGMVVDSERVDVEDMEANCASLAVAMGLAVRVLAA
ncbi:MAG: type IV pilus assembly protein PilM [Planctomycetota bacterium]